MEGETRYVRLMRRRIEEEDEKRQTEAMKMEEY
jgi:hypothetical protein